MTIESDQSQVCLDTFLSCQLLLQAIEGEENFSEKISTLLNDCAHICVGTFYAIKHGSVNAPRLALLCMGICEECAEVCESFGESIYKRCAEACRYCSSNLQPLAVQSLD